MLFVHKNGERQRGERSVPKAKSRTKRSGFVQCFSCTKRRAAARRAERAEGEIKNKAERFLCNAFRAQKRRAAARRAERAEGEIKNEAERFLCNAFRATKTASGSEASGACRRRNQEQSGARGASTANRACVPALPVSLPNPVFDDSRVIDSARSRATLARSRWLTLEQSAGQSVW